MDRLGINSSYITPEIVEKPQALVLNLSPILRQL